MGSEPVGNPDTLDRHIVATEDTCPACNRAYRVRVTVEVAVS